MAISNIPHTSGVYKITCIVNSKIYIGSANDILKRKIKHWASLRGNYHENRYLQNAWNKHGENNFIFEVIELVMPWSILEREQYWFDKLKPFQPNGFNVNEIATTPPSRIGCKLTEAHRLKISQGLKGKRNALGKKHKPEAKAIKSKIMKERPISSRLRERCAETHSKEFVVIKPNGDEILIKNLRKFCRENELSYSSMTEVAAGRRNSNYGWKCKRT